MTSIACPTCVTRCDLFMGDCPGCRTALDWIERCSPLRDALTVLADRSRDQDASPRAWQRPSIQTLGPLIQLDAGACECLGTDPKLGPGYLSPAADVAPRHALVVRRPWSNAGERNGSADCWIVAIGDSVFVNRARILSHRLAGGDLVQIGPYGWEFHAAMHGVRARLAPVTGLRGVRIEFERVNVSGRLHDVDLVIDAGSLTAITGPSGSGKSTLLNALLHRPTRGRILADGRDVHDNRQPFRASTCYLSQQPALHDSLTAEQIVAFSARLRGRFPTEEQVHAALDAMDLSSDQVQRPCEKLSGGEKQRVRLAAELISEPGLLLLDEPATGLDQDRATGFTRRLQTLARRGCTVVAVTHSRESLRQFDRVVEMSNGQVVSQGPGGGDATVAPAVIGQLSRSADRRSFFKWFTRGLSQAMVLADREWRLVCTAIGRRLIFPLTVSPLLFAVAIGVSVRPADRELLDFFAVLAVIWMSGSLSLMAIVDEREVFEHERLLTISPAPYVTAKTLVLSLMAAGQTMLFWAILFVVRSLLAGPDAAQPWWKGLGLLIVSAPAVGAGLLISALVGRNRHVASFMFPLLMIAQIAFSVHIAGRGEAALPVAYGEFSVHRCQGTGNRECENRAQRWTTRAGESPTEFAWLCDACRFGKTSAEDVAYHGQLPNMPNSLAATASYATWSRYGDILMRSDAGDNGDSSDAVAWRRQARAVLIAVAAWAPLATIVVLHVQAMLVFRKMSQGRAVACQSRASCDTS